MRQHLRESVLQVEPSNNLEILKMRNFYTKFLLLTSHFEIEKCVLYKCTFEKIMTEIVNIHENQELI